MRDSSIIRLYKNKEERKDCRNYGGIFLLWEGLPSRSTAYIAAAWWTIVPWGSVWFQRTKISNRHNPLTQAAAKKLSRAEETTVRHLYWSDQSFTLLQTWAPKNDRVCPVLRIILGPLPNQVPNETGLRNRSYTFRLSYGFSQSEVGVYIYIKWRKPLQPCIAPCINQLRRVLIRDQRCCSQMMLLWLHTQRMLYSNSSAPSHTPVESLNISLKKTNTLGKDVSSTR